MSISKLIAEIPYGKTINFWRHIRRGFRWGHNSLEHNSLFRHTLPGRHANFRHILDLLLAFEQVGIIVRHLPWKWTFRFCSLIWKTIRYSTEQARGLRTSLQWMYMNINVQELFQDFELVASSAHRKTLNFSTSYSYTFMNKIIKMPLSEDTIN